MVAITNELANQHLITALASQWRPTSWSTLAMSPWIQVSHGWMTTAVSRPYTCFGVV